MPATLPHLKMFSRMRALSISIHDSYQKLRKLLYIADVIFSLSRIISTYIFKIYNRAVHLIFSGYVKVFFKYLKFMCYYNTYILAHVIARDQTPVFFPILS